MTTAMDTSNNSNGSSQRRRLTKKPPAHLHAYNSFNAHTADAQGQGRFDAHPSSLHSKRSSTSLKRAPSAPPQRTRTTPTHSLSASNNSSPRHLPVTKSSGSNQPSPILATGEFLPSTFSPNHQPASRNFPASPIVGPGEAYAGGHYANHHHTSTTKRDHRLSDPHQGYRPNSNKASEDRDLIGAPFDGTSILNHLEATKTQGYQNQLSNRRPAPPPLAHAQTSPLLRQSASSSADSPAAMSLSEKAQQGAQGQLNGPKRYSDETKEPKAPGVLRKKSGFSGLMSTLVGSPKKPIISAPENPVHVTHVGYDSSTGQFTVCPSLCLCVIHHQVVVVSFLFDHYSPTHLFLSSTNPTMSSESFLASISKSTDTLSCSIPLPTIDTMLIQP